MFRGHLRRAMTAGALTFVLFGGGQIVVGSDIRPPSPVPPKPAIGDAKTYLLRYRFRINQVVRYEVNQTSVITTVRGPVRQTDRHSSKEHKHFAVTAVDDKQNVILEPVIDDVEMSARRDGRLQASYDSRRDKIPPKLFAGVAKSVGKPLVQLKVSTTGQLLKAVPLLDKAVQKTVVKNAGPNQAPNDPSKNFLIVLPEKPVSVGEKWDDNQLKVQLQVDRSLNLWKEYPILRTYRLVSVRGDLATIDLSMASLKPIKEPNLQVQMIQRLMGGTIVFDLKKGQIVSRESSVDNKVFGFAGARSVLHVKTERIERLDESPRTAGKRAERKTD